MSAALALILEKLAPAIPTLAGVAIGFLLAVSRDYFMRRRQRVNLASAVLLEVRWLDNVLRQIAATGWAASYHDLLKHPVIVSALAHLSLLDRQTGERVAYFHHCVEDLQSLLSAFREKPGPVVPDIHRFDIFVKGKAVCACRVVPDLVKALQGDGGKMPTVPVEHFMLDAATPTLPDLPPDLFGHPPR